jgi:hypothetical protein
MADIDMCHGIYCDKRNTCYRYMANANPWRQSFFAGPVDKDGKCSEYWPVSESELKRLKELREDKQAYNKFWGIKDEKENKDT